MNNYSKLLLIFVSWILFTIPVRADLYQEKMIKNKATSYLKKNYSNSDSYQSTKIDYINNIIKVSFYRDYGVSDGWKGIARGPIVYIYKNNFEVIGILRNDMLSKK